MWTDKKKVIGLQQAFATNRADFVGKFDKKEPMASKTRRLWDNSAKALKNLVEEEVLEVEEDLKVDLEVALELGRRLRWWNRI